jgi:hypothetical protein
MGSASLTAFVKKWSGRNAGPMDILSRYLAHVAMYVEDVFAVDSDSAVALAPFVIESESSVVHIYWEKKKIAIYLLFSL